MNTIYKTIWNPTFRASTPSKGAGASALRTATLLSALCLAMSASPVMAANSGLQLCDPQDTDPAARGIALGSGSTAPSALNCQSSGYSFSLNNRGDDVGSSGFGLSTARVTGYDNGLLELKGDGGISMVGNVQMNANSLTGLAAGKVSASSTDAVTGAQLFTTNAAVADLDGRMVTVEDSVSDLASQIEGGGLGLVKQDDITREITVAGDSDGKVINFGGTQGARVLDGVAAGAVNATSTQAINGSQLFAAGNSFAGALGGGSKVNADGSISAPVYRIGGTDVTGVGNAITGLDASVQANSDRIADIQGNMDEMSESLLSVANDAADRMRGIESNLGNLNGRFSQLETSIATGAFGDNGMVSSNVTDRSKLVAIASGEGALAVGDGAVASGDASTAIGTDSVASGANSVALGNGSVAERDNSVSVGATGQERQVTHVAAGTEDTDAVNVAQLKQSVRYDQNADGSTDYSRVSLGQEGTPVTLSNVAHGRVAADSSVAINGAQLYDWTMNQDNQFSNVSLGRQIGDLER
ncbi:MAG: YadA family autotransporter adhesin, partial [Pseudonocardiaceae bacterium]